MALELQLAHCETCNGYCSSTIMNKRDAEHPEIIDHYFYHGEPWFTLDAETFEESVQNRSADVQVVDFEEHLKDDLQYCTCDSTAMSESKQVAYHTANIFSYKSELKEYIQNDNYFYDLYIAYHNFHQDIPTRQAI